MKLRMMCTGQTGDMFTFTATYHPSKSDPNWEWSAYSPSASLSIVVTKGDGFEIGKVYDFEVSVTDMTPWQPEDTSTPDDGVRDNPADPTQPSGGTDSSGSTPDGPNDVGIATDDFKVTKSDSVEGE